MGKNYVIFGGVTGTMAPNTGQRATLGPNGLPRPIPLHRGPFGTHTSSFGVVADNVGIFIDNGTGIGNIQAAFNASEVKEVYGFNSHAHLDHTEALQHNFILYNKAVMKQFYWPILNENKTTDVLTQSFAGGKWPVSPRDVDLRAFTPGEHITCGPLVVKTHLQNHPNGGSSAFRIRIGNKRVVIATDNELLEGANSHEYAGFVNGADVLYADIQYTQDEYEGKTGIFGGKAIVRKGWGHSTPEMILAALDLCTVKPKLVLAGHHDATRNEADLLEFEKKLAKVFAAKGIEARSAREFECIEL